MSRRFDRNSSIHGSTRPSSSESTSALARSGFAVMASPATSLAALGNSAQRSSRKRDRPSQSARTRPETAAACTASDSPGWIIRRNSPRWSPPPESEMSRIASARLLAPAPGSWALAVASSITLRDAAVDDTPTTSNTPRAACRTSRSGEADKSRILCCVPSETCGVTDMPASPCRKPRSAAALLQASSAPRTHCTNAESEFLVPRADAAIDSSRRSAGFPGFSRPETRSSRTVGE